MSKLYTVEHVQSITFSPSHTGTVLDLILSIIVEGSSPLFHSQRRRKLRMRLN
jgi:hypothetical protein